MTMDSENAMSILKHVWNAGIPEEITGPINADYFCDQPNASVAQQALDFLKDQNNIFELRKRRQPEADIQRMWKATFRSCLAHAVPVPDNLKGFARRLGVVFP